MTDRSEMIVAYLDGTLEGAALTAFEAELEQNDALAEEVARFAANDDLLRAAFDAPMQEPVDAAMLERMGLGIAKAAGASIPAAAPLAANDNPPFWRRWQWPVGGAIAASLALLAVLQPGQGPRGESEFATALDSAPSATVVQLASGSSITPRLTFTAGDGRYCREYLQTGEAGSETRIACRRDGGWQIEATTRGGEPLPGSGEIGAASGENLTGLDAAYARLGASDPLNADAERALIARNWSKP